MTGEAHISTGISKPFMFDWVKHAAAQAASLHPDITVVFIGANDGFPLPDAVRTDVVLLRRGVGRRVREADRVDDGELPAGRGGPGLLVHAADPAKRRGPAGLPRDQPGLRDRRRGVSGPGVELIDLVPVFTPGDRYRQDMTYGGRTVDVREPDGYHLSLGGDAIAASILLGEDAADGLVR